MSEEALAAWIAFGATVGVGTLTAGISYWNARKAEGHAKTLSKEEHDRALAAAKQEAQLRVNAERELELFRLSAATVGPAHAALIALRNAAWALVVAREFDDLDEARVRAYDAALGTASVAGVMLPPELGEAYQGAADQWDGFVAVKKLDLSNTGLWRKEAENAEEKFANAVASWKTAEWERMTGKKALPPAEDPDADPEDASDAEAKS